MKRYESRLAGKKKFEKRGHFDGTRKYSRYFRGGLARDAREKASKTRADFATLKREFEVLKKVVGSVLSDAEKKIEAEVKKLQMLIINSMNMERDAHYGLVE